MRNIIGIAALGLVLAACGGGQKTSKSGMNKMASDAPPPPEGGNGEKIKRAAVSDDAKKDFAGAVTFYQEQEKAGWNANTCNAAARQFEQVASSHDKMVEAYYNAGLSYQNCGMMKDAEAKYQKALDIHPGYAPALSNLGQIYFLGGNEARAKQYWDKAVASDLKIVGARNNLAWLMIRQVRDHKANAKEMEEPILQHLRSVLAVENDNVEAYVLLSLLYMEGSDKNKSRLTLAKLLLDKAKELNEKFAPLYNARGLLELKNDNVAPALTEFQKAVELDPNFLEARMNIGNIVLGFRKYDDAAQQFQYVLQKQPKNYDAIIGLGVAQRGLKQLDTAEKSYNNAASVDSSRAEAFFNLGVLYKDFRANSTQDLHAAQAAYRQAIDYFTRSRSKPNATPDMQKDAADNISDCNKNISSLDEALRNQAAPPPAPTPPPAAPAGGDKKPG